MTEKAGLYSTFLGDEGGEVCHVPLCEQLLTIDIFMNYLQTASKVAVKANFCLSTVF